MIIKHFKFFFPLVRVSTRISSTDPRLVSAVNEERTFPVGDFPPGMDKDWLSEIFVRPNGEDYNPPANKKGSDILNGFNPDNSFSFNGLAGTYNIGLTLNNGESLGAGDEFYAVVIVPDDDIIQRRNFDSTKFFPKTTEEAVDYLTILVQNLKALIKANAFTYRELPPGGAIDFCLKKLSGKITMSDGAIVAQAVAVAEEELQRLHLHR